MTAKPTTTPRVKLIRAVAPDYFRFDFSDQDDDLELIETLRKAGILSVAGELDQALVREFLNYDPDTGELRWRVRSRKWFPSDRGWKTWNSRYSGKIVDGNHSAGYLRASIFHRCYPAHRLIWLWMRGVWPTEIDHLDRRRWNNCWANLREVTTQENLRNQTLRRTNKSGRMGVYWVSHLGKWRAHIIIDYRNHHLGVFETFEEAVEARAAAERLYGFSPGHGGRRQYQRVTLRRRPDHAQPATA